MRFSDLPYRCPECFYYDPLRLICFNPKFETYTSGAMVLCPNWRCQRCLRSIEESIHTDIKGVRVFINHRNCEEIKVL